MLTNDSPSLPENKSFHFDRYYVPSSPRPPEKPPDDDGIYFDIEPDMGVLTAKAFNHGILASKEEKSPHLLSHRGFKAFKIIHNFLNESPMMIYGGDMPILDVPYLHFSTWTKSSIRGRCDVRGLPLKSCVFNLSMDWQDSKIMKTLVHMVFP
ncbi:hypothetical protein Tco_0497908 [Tanacetum coccineum]